MHVEKLLKQWIGGMLKNGQKPTLMQIAAKYQMLAKRYKIKIMPLKNQRGFANRLLRKTGLQQKWRDGVNAVKVIPLYMYDFATFFLLT